MSDTNASKPSTIQLILHGVGIFLVFVFCYSGLTYLMKGNVVYAMSITLGITLALAGIIQGLIAQKNRELNQGFTIIEGILLFFYAGIAGVSLILMAHFINIEYALKDELRAIGKSKLNELTVMLDDYQTQVKKSLELTDKNIDNIIKAYGNDGDFDLLSRNLQVYDIPLSSSLGDSSLSARSQIMTQAHSGRKDHLKKDSATIFLPFKDVETQITNFVAQKSRVFDQWQSSKLHITFEEIDDQLTQSVDLLNQQISTRSPTYWRVEDRTFTYPISDRMENVLDKPFALMSQYNASWLVPFIPFLIVHLLILIPYLFISRKGAHLSYGAETSSGGIEV